MCVFRRAAAVAQKGSDFETAHLPLLPQVVIRLHEPGVLRPHYQERFPPGLNHVQQELGDLDGLGTALAVVTLGRADHVTHER